MCSPVITTGYESRHGQNGLDAAQRQLCSIQCPEINRGQKQLDNVQ
jgi:hypothetical protein